MSAASELVRHLTYREYLELERATDTRHEYVDGEAFAMAGGTPRHSKITTNLTVAVGAGLGDGSCQAFNGDLKVRVARYAVYPDLTIICGALVPPPEDPNAATNPTAVFEVLSPTTESRDRGEKFLRLQRVQSLVHFVLVSQDEPRVEVFSRANDGAWLYTVHGAGDTVELAAAGLSLAVDALYKNLPDEAAPQPAGDDTTERA